MARVRRRKKSELAAVAAPSLNSLMDIITIILVYLIKTFATSPVSVQDPSVQLPISTSIESVEDSVVVMVTGAFKKDFAPSGEQVMMPVLPTISVDDALIMQLDQDFSVPENEIERQFVIKRLKQRLLEVKKMQGVTAELTDSASTQSIVFVVDKNVPYRTLSKVLVSSAEAGFAEFKFAIVKSGG